MLPNPGSEKLNEDAAPVWDTDIPYIGVDSLNKLSLP